LIPDKDNLTITNTKFRGAMIGESGSIQISNKNPGSPSKHVYSCARAAMLFLVCFCLNLGKINFVGYYN